MQRIDDAGDDDDGGTGSQRLLDDTVPSVSATDGRGGGGGDGGGVWRRITDDVRVARERVVRSQMMREMLENRTDAFFIGGFALMHLVVLMFAHFLWVTADFRRPFLASNAALGVCGFVAVAWFALLAPRWFRHRRSAVEAREVGETPPPAQWALPERGSAEMNGLIAAALLLFVAVVLVDLAVRNVRGIAGGAQLAWLGTMLPLLVGVDYARHRVGRFVRSRLATAAPTETYTMRFPATAAGDAGGGGGVPERVHDPWLGGGNVLLSNWRVTGSLLVMQCLVVLTSMTFSPLPYAGVAIGAAIGYCSGAIVAGGGALIVMERYVRTMRSSNVVCFVAFAVGVLLVPLTVALDRGSARRAHSDTEPPDEHRFEHAGLLTLYVAVGGVLLYVYGVVGVRVVRRIGAVHASVLLTASLVTARTLTLLLAGRTEHVAWTAVGGCAAVVAAAAAYLYSAVAAQMKPDIDVADALATGATTYWR